MKNSKRSLFLAFKNFLRQHGSLLFLIVCFSLFVSRTLWTDQLPRTDDGELHGARLANYYLALKQGQFPPRWAPNLNYGFGNPMFIFSYPLPYILATLFYMIGFSIELSWNMVVIVSILAIGVGWYWLSFFYLRSKLWSLILAGLLLTTPYYLVNIFVRGAMGEIVFAGLIPWSILAVEYGFIFRNRKIKVLIITLFLSLILLAHQVLGPFFLIFISGYVFLKDRKLFKRFIPAFVMAVMCTSFFYLPAIIENNSIRLMEDESVQNLERAFVPIKDILWSDWTYGGKTGIVEEKFTRMIGPLVLFVILFFFHKIFQKELTKVEFFFLLTAILAIFLMTAHSLFIWNTFTFLRLMQFPWRLLQFAVLGSALFFLFALKNLPNQSMVKKILLIVAIMWISWVSVNWTQPISYISNSDHDWLEYGKLGDASGEFLPKNFDQHKNYTLAEQVVAGQIDDTQQQFFNNSDAQVEILSWNGTKKTYSVELQTESTIVEKTMYFPGRKVLVDGQHISIDSDNQLYPGRVVFSLPAGAHSIESIWTEDTLDRKVGNLLSVSGFLIILILAGLSVKERIKKRTDLFSINS